MVKGCLSVLFSIFIQHFIQHFIHCFIQRFTQHFIQHFIQRFIQRFDGSTGTMQNWAVSATCRENFEVLYGAYYTPYIFCFLHVLYNAEWRKITETITKGIQTFQPSKSFLYRKRWRPRCSCHPIRVDFAPFGPGMVKT